MIRLEPRLPAPQGSDGPREAASTEASFERTLDALAGRWYACSSTRLPSAADAGTLPDTDSCGTPAPAAHDRRIPGELVPAEAQTREPLPEPATTMPAAAADRVPPHRWVGSRVPELPTVASAEAVAVAVAASLASPTPHAAPSRAAAMPVGDVDIAPAPTSAAAAPPPLAPATIAVRGRVPDRRAAAPPAIESVPSPIAAPASSTTPPAALVTTVLQSANGRLTLAMRCDPLLRDSALDLARRWMRDLQADDTAQAAIVLNGELVSPQSWRT